MIYKNALFLLLMIPLLQGCFEFSLSSNKDSSSISSSLINSSSNITSSNVNEDIDGFEKYQVKTYVYGNNYGLDSTVKLTDFPMNEIYTQLDLKEEGDFFIVDDMHSFLTLYTSLQLICFDMPPEADFNMGYLDKVELAIRRTAYSPNEIKINYYHDDINNNLLAIEEDLDISDLCVSVECLDVIEVPKENFIIYYNDYIKNITHMEKVYHSQNNNYKLLNINYDIDSQILGNIFIDYEDLEYDGTLQELFDSPFNDEVIKKYFKVARHMRTEASDAFNDVEFKDLFIDGHKIYLTKIYDCSKYEPGDAVVSYYEHLILIPKHWEEKMYKINFDMVFNSHFLDEKDNTLLYDNLYLIKLAYLNSLYADGYKEGVNINNIYINKAYKEFENGTAVMIGCDLFDYPAVCWEEMIEGHSIFYGDGNRILIYYEHCLYNVSEAYEQGIITIDDVICLSNMTK